MKFIKFFQHDNWSPDKTDEASGHTFTVMAASRPIHTQHAVTMQFPCHAVPLRV